MGEPSVPEDYRDFVFAHADRVRTAAAALTGNEHLMQRLQDDLFVAVATRWWWLHRRWPGRWRAPRDAAQHHLWGLLRREAGAWGGTELRPMMFEPAPLPTATAADPAYRGRTDLLAVNTWAQAARQRRRRRLIGGAIVLALACGAVVMPGRSTGPDAGPGPGPRPGTSGPALVSAAPPNVAILPRMAVLADEIDPESPLPVRIGTAIDAARPLADDPLPEAIMLAQLTDGPLILIAETGQARRVDAETLGDARAVETSLSPDGTLAALPALDGVLIIDIARGSTRKITSVVPRPPAFRPTLVWRTARTLIVTEAGGTSQVDVATGDDIGLSLVTGVHTVVQQGGADRLTDLLAVGPQPGEPALLRIWDGLAATAAPTGGGSVREVTDAPWLGGWLGAGWANESLVVRACTATNLRLPPTAGTPTALLVAVEVTGRTVSALAIVEPGVTATMLGWLNDDTALARLSLGPRTAIVAWNVADRRLGVVSSLDTAATLSVADLLARR